MQADVIQFRWNGGDVVVDFGNKDSIMEACKLTGLKYWEQGAFYDPKFYEVSGTGGLRCINWSIEIIPQPIGLKDHSSLFRNSKELRQLDLRHWDVSGVVFTDNMFRGCVNLEQLDLYGCDLSSVTTMGGMSFECEKSCNSRRKGMGCP